MQSTGRRSVRASASALIACLLAVGCSAADPVDEVASSTVESTTTAATTATTTTALPAVTTTAPRSPTTEPGPDRTGSPPPQWLGTNLLPLRPDEHGVAGPTPPELIDRRLWTTDTLLPPTSEQFVSTIQHPVPDEVLARSTWTLDCPVHSDALAYATVSFVGFDGLVHTGELLTNRQWVEDLVATFEFLFELRFPIEEMRVTTPGDVEAHPTGDSNNTGSFVCRPTVTSNGWSQHAYGLAIDINPFHNPYVSGDLVIPELAIDYGDRSRRRPGMVTAELVQRFDALGWGWGGTWTTASDWMHFSVDGR